MSLLNDLLIGQSSAVIVLHAPHVDMQASICPSRDRALQASRAIVASVHALCATTFDILLLPHNVIWLWECSAGILGLFYCHALMQENEEDAAMFRSELEVFVYVSLTLALQGCLSVSSDMISLEEM